MVEEHLAGVSLPHGVVVPKGPFPLNVKHKRSRRIRKKIMGRGRKKFKGILCHFEMF